MSSSDSNRVGFSSLSDAEIEAVELFSQNVPINEIGKRMGISGSAARDLVRSASLSLGANDDLIDEQLRHLENWERSTGRDLFELQDAALAPDISECSVHKSEFLESAADGKERSGGEFEAAKAELLAKLEEEFSNRELRDFAGSLTKLADSREQGWRPGKVERYFRWPSAGARIERNSVNLAMAAQVLIDRNELRGEFLPTKLFDECGWRILLELFVQYPGRARVSDESLTIVCKHPPASVRRHLAYLEGFGLVEFGFSDSDNGVRLFRLTKEGVLSVGRYLEKVSPLSFA